MEAEEIKWMVGKLNLVQATMCQVLEGIEDR